MPDDSGNRPRGFQCRFPASGNSWEGEGQQSLLRFRPQNFEPFEGSQAGGSFEGDPLPSPRFGERTRCSHLRPLRQDPAGGSKVLLIVEDGGSDRNTSANKAPTTSRAIRSQGQRRGEVLLCMRRATLTSGGRPIRRSNSACLSASRIKDISSFHALWVHRLKQGNSRILHSRIQLDQCSFTYDTVRL